MAVVVVVAAIADERLGKLPVDRVICGVAIICPPCCVLAMVNGWPCVVLAIAIGVLLANI